MAATKEVLGFDPSHTFEVAEEVLAHTRQLVEPGPAVSGRVAEVVRRLGGGQPEGKAFYDRMVDDELTPGWEDAVPSWEADRRHRHPGGVRHGAERVVLGAARAVGRLGRPGRVQKHHHGE